MGEIKSVKVDNWGVFFLQKLQNFFNKTDYCDLTLQFRDNSQLKVHRLVLSACTDYFNVLEQTCEVVDDAIIMPNGLQADVVVPIVNFMYTGTLEFELKMYNRLLRTAKDMNMTVLLKLLEAHRRTMEMHPQKSQAPSSPKSRRKPAVANTMGNTAGRSLIQQPKRIVIGGNVPQQPQQQQRNVPANIFTRVTSSSNTSATSLLPVKQQIGSTTFTRIKQESEQDENVGAGYTLLKKPSQQQSAVASPFEQLRKGYNNNKRPAATTFVSPPAKKPNLEDVKEFAEQQRMRKQIAAEFVDDGDYDAGIMDDDTIHNDDDDDDMGAGATIPTSASTAVQTSSVQQQQQSEDPPGTTTIIVKHEGPDKPPTIVVKDSSNSKMNHAKIISEVLRQYPHLVNSNKNIKLKIMPNAGGQTQKIIVKKEPVEPEKAAAVASAAPKLPTLSKGVEGKVQPVAPALAPSKPTKPQAVQACTISAAKVGMSGTTNPSISPPTTAPSQKRRIDSKTMHALIALGAENTTGPWLCLRCGRNGHPISIPSYRGFRRHLINTHKEQIDLALCEHCGWRSSGKRELHFHMQLEHKVKTNLYIFPECQLCQQMCIDSDALNQHLIDSHPEENKQQCIYCNKIFPEELQLYTHMKTFHKKQALEDGIIDYSDDENTNTDLVYPPPLEDHEMEDERAPQQQEEKKIKILSDISLPIASSIVNTTETVVAAGESTTSVASEEYLHEHQEHVETKFVAADGSEVILTDEQRKEILSQLNQENEGSGVVMVLNENQQYAGGETQSEQGALSHDETSQATTATNDEHEDHDSQIYNELKAVTQQATVEEDTTSQTEPEDTRELEAMDEEESQQTPVQEDGKVHHHDAALDESKESTDNLEWAENLISEHDMADEVSPTTAEISGGEELNKEGEQKDDVNKKAQEDISKKLKELAGDWSEDEEDDEEMLGGQATPKPEESEEISEKENAAIEEGQDLEHGGKTEPEKRIEAEVETANTLEDVLASQHEPESRNEDIKESVEKEADPIVEDDVDLALKSLHKEDEVEEDQSGTKENEEVPETQVDESITLSTDNKESENIVQETSETGKTLEEDVKINNDNIKDQADVLTVEKVASSLADDEESKKDLIDMLISDNVESTREVAETGEQMKEKEEELKDTLCKEEEEEKVEDIAGSIASIGTESTVKEPAIEDEFLDIAPEKAEVRKDEPAVVAASSTSTDDTTCATTAPKDSVTSEERVKSLISEWGDDDEDEENADADLTANL